MFQNVPSETKKLHYEKWTIAHTQLASQSLLRSNKRCNYLKNFKMKLYFKIFK